MTNPTHRFAASNDLDAQDREALDLDTLGHAFGIIERLVQLVHREPVAEYASPDALRQRLDLALASEGIEEGELFEILEQIAETTPRTTGRLFFNQLFGGRDTHAAAAELIATILNVSMYTYKVAGPHALIEQELTRRMGDLAGLPEGEGIFTPGGSLSNMCGMVMARNHALPESKDQGLAGSRVAVYASEECHYSVAKNAGILGFGRSSVRKIATDDDRRMDPAALRAAIEQDKADGITPICIIPTSGTTVLGVFDPIDAIADIAEEQGIWLHVDGALGGSALLSPETRPLMDGIERADSFAWNMHKMMGAPLSTSVVLTKAKGPLTTAFSESATYLFQSENDELNAGTRSIQCGRSNEALKLWAMWKKLGDQGLAERVDHLFAMGQHAAERVRQEPSLTLTREPTSVTVCFTAKDIEAPELCEQLRQRADAMVGFAIVDGNEVVRLACVNPQMTSADLDEFFDLLVAVVER